MLGFALLVVGFFRGPMWPADLGLLAGFGTTCLVIALINAVSSSLDPTFWALSGVTFTALGAGPFWWLRCRRADGSSRVTSA